MKPLSNLCLAGVLLSVGFSQVGSVRADAMLQLFNVSWNELSQKLPEIAEAGYTSLWLPPPTKGGSGYSVGYDLFDPFDLGDQDQRGTVATLYGTKAEFLQVVTLAHRFGLRVYFDNVVNHRGFEVPGYDALTPTNLYPGLLPGDFHLQTIAGGFYRNWDNISDWNNVWQIQNQPLSGLLDLAHETPNNVNFGPSLGSTASKPVFVRHPNHPEYYPDPRLPALPGGWRGFNGASGVPVAEDVNSYLIRAVQWLLSETKCDGFRLDAVKHVPGSFFGDYGSASPYGYCGAIQTMYDYVHGYGNNLLGNGYVEADDNRNSCYDAEAVRNDALIFGEHLGEPPSYDDYLGRGMRLLDNPLRNNLNSILGNPGASLAGYEQRDAGGFNAAQRVMHAQSHDNAYASHRELQNAYFFFREGVPLIYSDGYNMSQTCSGCGDPFPRNAYAPYLGQYGDPKMPDLAWLHQQLARGGSRPRWGDADVIAFERYDYREGSANSPQDQTVVLFAMNDNFGDPGDVSFDDGVLQSDDGMPSTCYPVQNSRGQGLVVGFPPGSYLVQMADAPGADRACARVLVRQATNFRGDAEATRAAANPAERKVYVGSQTLAPGGGAIEFKIPSGGYVAYAYQWPEASLTRPAGFHDAITLRQGGGEAPRLTVLRKDGRNGDPGFNPVYPFKMRGSTDASGGVVGGQNVGSLTYAIDIPVVTNAPFDWLLRCDASAANLLAKLDGGLDLNSQMAIGPTSGLDRRDNKPGSAYDTFLGYEQTLFRSRSGPEKFAATNVANNTALAVGAETYAYTIGGGSSIAPGAGGGLALKTATASWVYHDPRAAADQGPATQRFPLAPTASQSAQVWVKVGYQFQIDQGNVYYTTDGTEPAGSFGVASGSTRLVALGWDHTQSGDPNGLVDWWKATLPAQPAGLTVRYKIALFKGAGVSPISDADAAKRYGFTQFAVTNFDPRSATVWLHNDLNPALTVSGLQEGFHVARARAFLPRDGKSSVFNTFVQTFYYDAGLPAGALVYPAEAETLRSGQYGVVVRTDDTVTSVEINVQDNDPRNDDSVTGQPNGNGLTNGVPAFAPATAVTPLTALNAQYPAWLQEWRFNYTAVPSNGNAVITVRLKKLTSSLYPNRVTLLQRTNATVAPPQTLGVAYPAFDGQILSLASGVNYTPVFRFSDSLPADTNLFAVKIDGAMQPRSSYRFDDQTPGDNQNELRLTWTNPPPGAHVLECAFNGSGLTLQTLRFVSVQLTGVPVYFVNPPAADTQGRSPYQIMVPTASGQPLLNSFSVITETASAVTNVTLSLSNTSGLFWSARAVRDSNFISGNLRWNYPWTNLTPGLWILRADAVGGGTNRAFRAVQIVNLPVDALGIFAPAKLGDAFTFQFQTLNSRTYLVEYTDTLPPASWTTCQTFAGDGSPHSVTNVAPGILQRFFRYRTL